MERKIKPRYKREFILYENSFLCTLNREQRCQLDRKEPIIYTPIQFVENVRHGVSKRKAFFEFTNTVNIPHWSDILKIDLLEKSHVRGYNVLTKVPINSIFDVPEAVRKNMEAQALAVAERMDAEADYLKTCKPTFHRDSDPILELCKMRDGIEDNELLRYYNQAVREVSEINQLPYVPVVESVPEIRKRLKEYETANKMDTLTKTAELVEEEFFQRLHPLELISIISDINIISVTENELQQVIDRYRNENPPNLDVFSPYAAKAIRLYLTLDIFLMANSQNTLSKEVLRDYDYLYYVLCGNVTFVSADKAHKKFIEEIPVLNSVRQRFIYFDKRSDEVMKEVLKKLGIKG